MANGAYRPGGHCWNHCPDTVSLEPESFNANFVVIDDTRGYHDNGNLQCQKWRKSWHYNNARFSAIVFGK